jgi:hypothetical protein
MPRFVAGALLLVLASCAGTRAGSAPLEPESGFSDREVRERTRFIEERLEDRQLHAQIWYWGWTTVFTGSTIANGYGAATTDHGPNSRERHLAGGAVRQRHR